jgi:hypothetical protein
MADRVDRLVVPDHELDRHVWQTHARPLHDRCVRLIEAKSRTTTYTYSLTVECAICREWSLQTWCCGAGFTATTHVGRDRQHSRPLHHHTMHRRRATKWDTCTDCERPVPPGVVFYSCPHCQYRACQKCWDGAAVKPRSVVYEATQVLRHRLSADVVAKIARYALAVAA